jgi:hypothetical protein
VGGEREGAEWGEMTQALYAHMNNKKIKIKKKKRKSSGLSRGGNLSQVKEMVRDEAKI